MKHLCLLALLFCGGVLMAGTDIDINGKFAGSKVGDKVPKRWNFNKSIKFTTEILPSSKSVGLIVVEGIFSVLDLDSKIALAASWALLASSSP